VNSQTELQEATQATDELLEEQEQVSSRVELLAGQLEAHQEEKDRVRTGLGIVLKKTEADTARCRSTSDSESSQLAQREASLADLLAEIDAARQVLACRSTQHATHSTHTLTPSCTQAESTLVSQLSELKVLERAKIETALNNQFGMKAKILDEEYQLACKTASAAQSASLQALEASASRLRGDGDEVDEDDEDEAKEPVVPAASKAAVASRKSPRGSIPLRKSPRGGAARR
jgi:hypothetical protein